MKENYEDLEGFIRGVQYWEIKKCFITSEVKTEQTAVPRNDGMVQGTKIVGQIRLSAGKQLGTDNEIFVLYSEPVVMVITVADQYKDFEVELTKKQEEITKKLQKEISSVRLETGVVFP